MAPKTVPPIDLSGIKEKLQGLKARGEALTSRKEELLKEGAAKEQEHKQALAELSALGYPEVSSLDLKGLLELSGKLAESLTGAVSDLEKTVNEAEELLNTEVVQGM